MLDYPVPFEVTGIIWTVESLSSFNKTNFLILKTAKAYTANIDFTSPADNF